MTPHASHEALGHGAHVAHAAPSVASVVLVTAVCLALVAYVTGVRREARRTGWPPMRTASFALGAALIVLAMSPPVSDWAHRDLRGHMLQHLLLGMFAPLALMLGAPGTLLLRNLPTSAARRLIAFLDRGPIRVLLHPVTAAILDIGGMFVLYLTPLYAYSQSSPGMHLFLHVHFVLSGYLFSWSIAGPDPAPHRPAPPVRLAVVFLAMAAHGMLGKLMYAAGHPRGTAADPAEIEAAAQWMFYGGDLAELLLVAVLVPAWFRRRAMRDGVPMAPRRTDQGPRGARAWWA